MQGVPFADKIDCLEYAESDYVRQLSSRSVCRSNRPDLTWGRETSDARIHKMLLSTDIGETRKERRMSCLNRDMVSHRSHSDGLLQFSSHNLPKLDHDR